MTKVGAQSSASDILSLIQFVLVSYLAIMLMFLVHAAILMFFRVNPLLYFKRAWPALIFAFSSRSSAATIPINVSIQVNDLDNHPAVANMFQFATLSAFQRLASTHQSAVLVILMTTRWPRQLMVSTKLKSSTKTALGKGWSKLNWLLWIGLIGSTTGAC